MFLKSVFLLIFLFFISSGNAYNFLVISPVFGFSHMKVMAILADILADAGHNVTIFQPFVVDQHRDKKLVKNDKIEILNYFHDEEGQKNMKPAASSLADTWYSYKYESDIGMAIFAPKILYPTFEHMCRRIFQDTELHDLLISRKFDVVISEAFDFCGLYLADYLKMPAMISIFTGNRMNALIDAIGEPSPLNYLPSPSSRYGKDATIYDRFNDFWHISLIGSAFKQIFNLQYQQVSQLTNGKVQHWKDIMGDVTYHFSNSNPYLDFVTPTISKVIPIGGFTMKHHDKPPKVSQKIDEILSKRAFTVFVSFGSMVRSADMIKEQKNGMVELFKNNPNITFLWKYEELEDDFVKNDLPENAHVDTWWPQPALLADNRVNLFITHGGLGSTMELAYAAKPAIVIPIFADQFENAHTLSRHGSVEVYSKHEIPEWRKLSNVINNVIIDPVYTKNAQRLAEILKNQPISPNELVVKYAEHAAKFGKIPTLSPHARNMGFIEFYNLDIIFLAFSMFLFLIYLVIETFLTVRNCLKSKKIKTT